MTLKSITWIQISVSINSSQNWLELKEEGKKGHKIGLLILWTSYNLYTYLSIASHYSNSVPMVWFVHSLIISVYIVGRRPVFFYGVGVNG